MKTSLEQPSATVNESCVDRNLRAGFWRRLAAAWIDAFVIYALCALPITLAAVVRIRIALEPLFVVIGAAYGTILLAQGGQTVGKTLMGIAVTPRTGGALSLRQAMLREMLGKWGIIFVLPVVLGRMLVGRAWVPTFYDLLAVLLVLLFLRVYYLIVRCAWYDQLAGTEVNRAPIAYGKIRLAAVALVGAALLGLGTKGAEFALRGWIPCRLALFRSMRSTAPYVAFLRQGQVAPVDYLIGLFDQYDVVVLCERMHPEGSQWNFIYDIVRDPRFIDRVGHVFTEYGTGETQTYLDSMMAADGLSAGEVHDRVVQIMRNWAVWPTWENTNIYRYLTRLYALNQSLPAAKRIHHHFTDKPPHWSGIITKGQYIAYRRSLVDRDQYMARTVIEEMGRLAKPGSRPPKCLVVMNYRHAFDLTNRSPKAPRGNTYEYLKDAFGYRAANVLLNYWLLLPQAGGVWDAAFEETGNRPVGFDFKGSPFGGEPFDMFPFRPKLKGELRYRDVFTGFVFVNPLDSQYTEVGVPGFHKGFEDEALRRAALVGEDYLRGMKASIAADKSGTVPMKKPLPYRVTDSALELSMLGVLTVGLLIGLAAFALYWRRGKSQREETGKNM
ncbi:MAG: RDD family protein [Terriglobia bacterium]